MTRRARRTGRDPRGFTLVEMLVALALAGVVLLALSGGLALTTRGAERLAAATMRIDDARHLDLWLRREIEAALPPDAGGAMRRPFAGTRDALRFLTIAADDGGHCETSIALESPPDTRAGSQLVLLRQPLGGGLPARIVLARGVAGLEIAYWGRAAEDAAARWHADWSDLRVLPAMLRIALRMADGTQRPPLLVRLKAADPEARAS